MLKATTSFKMAMENGCMPGLTTHQLVASYLERRVTSPPQMHKGMIIKACLALLVLLDRMNSEEAIRNWG